LERRTAFAKSDPLRVVFVTAPEEEALKLARTLLEETARCVRSIIEGRAVAVLVGRQNRNGR